MANMSKEGACIFDTWVDLKLTKAGHYAIHILPDEQGRTRPTSTLQTATLQTSRQKNLQEKDTLFRNRLKSQETQDDLSNNNYSEDDEPKEEMPQEEVPAQPKEPKEPEVRLSKSDVCCADKMSGKKIFAHENGPERT